jgi:capsular exopolysaccharide synthesis family protein
MVASRSDKPFTAAHLYRSCNISFEGEAGFMSAILGTQTVGTGRSAYFPRPRLVERKRLTVQPDGNSRLVYLTDPEGLAVESYRLLRRRLCTLHPEGGVVLMTSPAPGEGKTLTSMNLAWALAEANHATCLLDLDFRAPGMSRVLDYGFDEGGVVEVLEGEVGFDDALRQLGDHPLDALGIKRRLSSPGHLFQSTAMNRMIASLRTMYKWTVLDFAPVIPMADVSEMLPYVDGAILVVRAGKTEKSMLEPAMNAIGTKLWGVVVNDCTINGSAYYGDYGKRR